MKSRQVREKVRRGNERQEERHRGIGVSTMKMGSQRVAETQVIHMGRLPVQKSDAVLQNADGSFKFLANYSDALGGDV